MIMGTSTLQKQYDYRESQKDFWDINNVIETAEKKGVKRIAKEMKKDGVPFAVITKYTDLTEEEIEKL